MGPAESKVEVEITKVNVKNSLAEKKCCCCVCLNHVPKDGGEKLDHRSGGLNICRYYSRMMKAGVTRRR